MVSDHESKYGIHGGDVETSLMLHFRPELVRMDKA
ncbi:creatininase family protein, partial [Rhizobium leguminosarum]